MKFNPLAAAVVSIVLLLVLVVLLRSVIGAPIQHHKPEQQTEMHSTEVTPHDTLSPEVVEEKPAH